MEENKQLKEKEQLIEAALEKVIQGGETNYKLAIWDLQKAKDISPFFHNNDYLNQKCDVLTAFLEILTGIENSRQKLVVCLLERSAFNLEDVRDQIYLKNIDRIYLPGFTEDLLKKQLADIWLKSLKYDALVKALEDSESDTMKDKEKLAKVKRIIGEVKPE
ncbi:hypothetical protein SAMN03080617_04158 [Algoriphagus alkaliphilus]|uniref:Uncharacterized protein n=1 Tax=Algoriphagus alkaliphilus TaxID=279824 RepID=A0A1G5ZN80_9BACT|nr:hypothetical protein [Algoriphagus alkaliphilus]SDA95986.1 hypothetical protein SAMN03080617_04158 [Algoriphagus alkaliphilus]